MIEVVHMTKAEIKMGTIKTVGVGTILETIGVKVNIMEVTEVSLRRKTCYMTEETNNDTDDSKRSMRSRSVSGSKNRHKCI